MASDEDGHGAGPRLPVKPMLPGFYRVIPMGADAIQLRTAGRVLRVGGSGVGDFGPRLLRALDGHDSLGALSERLALDPGTAADLVRHLHAEGIVLDADDNGRSWRPTGGNPADHDVYGELGKSPAVVQAAIWNGRVAMVGLGPVGRLAARHLAGAGIGELVLVDRTPVSLTDQSAVAGMASQLGRPRAEVTREECVSVLEGGDNVRPGVVRSTSDPIGRVAEEVDLVVVEVDEAEEGSALANVDCIAAGVVSLFHSVTTFEAVVGPMVVPGAPSCHRCLVERKLSHLRHYEEHVAYQTWLRDGGTPRQAALLSGFASVAAGLVSMEVLRVVGGFQDPVTRGGVLVADFRTSHVRREELVAVPACPACDARPEDAVVGS